ncbi:MAG: hypothetical protein JWL96_1281 [Sphingomonas bacterium]|uniref:tetratricopeptide repeat protein n=1 Tax=Sphingomonas bacterium TaxID=1895847 RepID=UPI00262C28C7|nr:tetratricopeptide repeat protein [Sphingomonas bacterium]MDB5709211.1 hypothetical protein [Sphingomonas bacterium]
MSVKIASVILCGIASCILAVPALASHWEAGQHAFEARNFATALKEWQAGADAGEIDSLYELGVMFREGQGTPRDAAKGFELNRRAAEAGYWLALSAMQTYYHEGIGVAADDVEATRWVRRTADQADSSAMRKYAWALQTGAGVKVDKVAAVDWYERSFLYDDFTTASVMMVSESDWGKYPFTRNGYDNALEKGELPKIDLAVRFREILKLADAGDREAQFEAGMMYFISRGAERNA